MKSLIYVLIFAIHIIHIYASSYGSARIVIQDDTTAITDYGHEYSSIQTISYTTDMSTLQTLPPIYIITEFTVLATTSEMISTSEKSSTIPTNPNTSTTTISPYPNQCDTSTHVLLNNGTCISKAAGQMIAADLLHTYSTNSTVVADALSLYISSITDSDTELNSSSILTLDELDGYLKSINNVSLNRTTNDSFLLAMPPNEDENKIILGASFTRQIGGKIIDNFNIDTITNSNLSVAAVVSNQSLIGVTSLNILIIRNPSAYRNIDNFTGKLLASSIVMVSVRGNNAPNSMNISLYFQVLPAYKPNVSAIYSCSFYDSNTSQWNSSGCTPPVYNEQFDRYECSCNHLTSFGLMWLPRSLLLDKPHPLRAEDIASLVFQSVSIISFLAVITHAIYIRIRHSKISLNAYNLLPLISFASTTILFIFHIALGMTVYTKRSSENETKCFLSSSILMFFVYFFLIFMFCVKTSVGYFNYLRFVHLFPQPSIRKLFLLLLISFFISILCVAIAIGLDLNPSFSVTQLYPYAFCWFTHDVLYYFLTIPVCLFLLINIIILIIVTKRMINHIGNATSSCHSYRRAKRCVLILLLSCITQGVGWLFGPLMLIVGGKASEIFEWIFNVVNGLEGFWSIVLYIILRFNHMDEYRHVTAANELKRSSTEDIITDSNNRKKIID